MMSKIPWTEKTWNPIIGCSKVSAGCAHCYAEKMAKRLSAMECAKLHDVVPAYSLVVRQGRWNDQTVFVESMLQKPLRRKKPTLYFVCSMGDFWHGNVKPEWRERVYDVVRRCPQHTFQFLTKRPQLIRDWPADLPNGWLGVTIENNYQLHRIYHLMQVNASVRFLSMEPLIGPLDDLPLKDIDWVIVGCESGPGRRPCKTEWVDEIHEQCYLADVPCFVKQIDIDGTLVKMPVGYPQEMP